MKQIKRLLYNDLKEDLEKFALYSKTKNINLRNELVQRYIPLIEFMTENYCRKNNVNKDDIIGFAYEGLILGLEDFNESHKAEFYRYLNVRIYQYLDMGLMRIKSNSFMESNTIKLIDKIIKQVEIEEDNSIFKSKVILNKVIDKVHEVSNINKLDILNYININIIKLPHNKEIYYEQNYYEAYDGYAKDLLKSAINNLKPIEKRIIEYIFGYYDGKYYELEEIKEIENLSLSKIHYIKNNALNKLKSMPEIKRLDGILEIYDEKEKNDYKLKKRR